MFCDSLGHGLVARANLCCNPQAIRSLQKLLWCESVTPDHGGAWEQGLRHQVKNGCVVDWMPVREGKGAILLRCGSS